MNRDDVAISTKIENKKPKNVVSVRGELVEPWRNHIVEILHRPSWEWLLRIHTVVQGLHTLPQLD